jgi:hypothetical protein
MGISIEENMFKVHDSFIFLLKKKCKDRVEDLGDNKLRKRLKLKSFLILANNLPINNPTLHITEDTSPL